MTETIYLGCAVVGGTLLLCQFLLGLLGFGDHHDVGGDVHDVGGDHHDAHGSHDADASWFIGVLTFRSVVAALTFFGLAGLTGTLNFHMEQPVAFAFAAVSGVGALLGVSYLMKLLHRLKSDGTVHIERAVGLNGTVYLTIPAGKKGAGKVTLNLQNRTVEYQAVTTMAALPTGAAIVVTAVVGPDTVEVAPATQPGVWPCTSPCFSPRRSWS